MKAEEVPRSLWPASTYPGKSIYKAMNRESASGRFSSARCADVPPMRGMIMLAMVNADVKFG